MATPQKDTQHSTGPIELTWGTGDHTEQCRYDREALERLGAELLRRAEESQPALEAAWDELLAGWGIHGQPVGVKRLRATIEEECRSSPEDREFSREVISLREERRP